jgi:hypothetical protein
MDMYVYRRNLKCFRLVVCRYVYVCEGECYACVHDVCEGGVCVCDGHLVGTVKENAMIKFNSLVRSGRNGVKEITTGEMTVGETMVACEGVALTAGGAMCWGLWSAIGTKAAAGGLLAGYCALSVIVGKASVVVGPALVVGAIGKAFVRGAYEQLQTELKVQD